jgi:hypothetical protein
MCIGGGGKELQFADASRLSSSVQSMYKKFRFSLKRRGAQSTTTTCACWKGRGSVACGQEKETKKDKQKEGQLKYYVGFTVRLRCVVLFGVR